jgi:uncharacterized protein YnzC (UPF0291/DUF896 family)
MKELKINERGKKILDVNDGDFGTEIGDIFNELAETQKIEKMTDDEKQKFLDNLKRVIDCEENENLDLNLKMAILDRSTFFPYELTSGMYNFIHPPYRKKWVKIDEWKKPVIDIRGNYYGAEIQEIFDELAETQKIENMTRDEKQEYLKNLKRIIDCEENENLNLHMKMSILCRVIYFPCEVNVERYTFVNPIPEEERFLAVHIRSLKERGLIEKDADSRDFFCVNEDMLVPVPNEIC